MPRKSEVSVLMTHVTGLDLTNAEQLTEAEIIGRRQALRIASFFKKHVPGCEECVLSRTAAQIGVRESRRIVGDYVLTGEDVLEGHKFKDSVARTTVWIDLHDPTGEGVLHDYLRPNEWFEIPYRSLLVKGFDNLLVVGKCMSATHEGMSAIRVIPPCILTGEAAGTAAALAVQEGVTPRELEITRLQRALRAQGADVGEHP